MIFRLLIILSSALLICADLDSQEVAEKEYLRLPVPQQILKDGRKQFFSIYMQGSKLGSARYDLSKKVRDGKLVWVYEKHHELKAGKVLMRREHSEEWFSVKSPYRFVGGFSNAVTSRVDLKANAEILKNGNFELSLNIDGKSETFIRPAVDYTLSDQTTPLAWITGHPQKNEEKILTRRLQLFEMTIKKRELQLLPPSAVTDQNDFYKVKQSGSYIVTIDQSGYIREAFAEEVGSGYKLIAVKESEFNIETATFSEMRSSSIIPANMKLGNPRLLLELTLKIKGIDAELIPSGPNQTAVFDSEKKELNLKIGRRHRTMERTTDKSRAEFLKDKKLYQISNYVATKKLVNGLVAKALEGDGTPIEDEEKKIIALVHFVSEFIEDMRLEQFTVGEIIESKKGTCAEHAILFVAMARSCGIPARQVSGFIYAPEIEGFGAHSWAEVALKGMWRPVDPLLNELQPNAGHIRVVVQGSGGPALGLTMGNNLKAEVVHFKKR